MRFGRSAFSVIAVVVAVLAAGFAAWQSSTAPGAVTRHARPHLGATEPTITVGPALRVQPVRAGFLGFSFEYSALGGYAGTDPNAVDPVFEQLIRNLAEGGPTVLRIGGNSTDRTWWPVADVSRSPAGYYTLTRSGVEVLAALARATDAHLILGVNLEANSTVEAAAESRAMLAAIPRRLIDGFELGNEPELYGTKWYYKRDGENYFSRPRSWNFQSYLSDYRHIAAAMGRVPLAGPGVGVFSWMRDLGQFLDTEHLAVVTLHRYPLQSCGPRPGSPKYPTISNFLSTRASTDLADGLRPYVAIAHAHHVLVRNGEMNSVSCGPARGSANTFASALWALDTMFAMASVGLDGVNIHTYSGYIGQPFTITRSGSRWLSYVTPEYYGMLMFAQAAPAGSRLLGVSGTSPTGTIRAWATRTPSGQTHVVLINDSTEEPQSLTLHMPGAAGAATVERLEAPSVHSKLGVTIGGRTFGGQTTTGLLSGRSHLERIVASAGTYRVSLPAASAAMLTFR
jgi:hypothetical protein